jgi:hypothetical protein
VSYGGRFAPPYALSLLRFARKRNLATQACDKTTRRANQQNLSSPFAKNIPLNPSGKSVI